MIIRDNSCKKNSLSKLPEGDGGGSGDVERIDIVEHRDADYVIGIGDGLFRQAITLGAHHDGQAGHFLQARVIERNTVIAAVWNP